MSVIPSVATDIPITEYISGKAIYNNIAQKVFYCNKLGDYNNIVYPSDTPSIIYCHTDFVNKLLIKISTYNNNFIIISHNSDGKITYNPKHNSDANLNLMPSNILAWFGQNVAEHHSRLYSIPIGLENDYWSSENKHQQVYNQSRIIPQIRNLCYLNVNPDTNPNERLGLYYQLKDENWVTKHYGRNGVDFSIYIDNIKNHYFVLCPEGNQNGHNGGFGAIGSHRVWETLYVGSIPIVKQSIASSYFNDLPIVFIEDWKYLTKEFLEIELHKILNKQYNLQKMLLSYWLNLIDTTSILLQND